MNRETTKHGLRSRVWLRSMATNEFFGPSGDWVKHREEAFDFTDVQKALVHAKSSGINGLEVILETVKGDFPVPIMSASSQM